MRSFAGLELGRDEGATGAFKDTGPAPAEQNIWQGAGDGRARVSRHAMPVRLSQGSLSRHRQERRAGVFIARARELVSGPPDTCVQLTKKRPEGASPTADLANKTGIFDKIDDLRSQGR